MLINSLSQYCIFNVLSPVFTSFFHLVWTRISAPFRMSVGRCTRPTFPTPRAEILPPYCHPSAQAKNVEWKTHFFVNIEGSKHIFVKIDRHFDPCRQINIKEIKKWLTQNFGSSVGTRQNFRQFCRHTYTPSPCRKSVATVLPVDLEFRKKRRLDHLWSSFIERLIWYVSSN